MFKLVRIITFISINILNIGIAMVGVSYFNPSFQSGYLVGKEKLYESFFFKIGLLTHASSAPIALLLFSFLVLFKKETAIELHKRIGKIALIIGFFIVFPSGMILSYYAMGGAVGKFIFFSLSAFMGFSLISAYKTVLEKKYVLHEYWMKNSLLLLCSALLLRILLYAFHSINWHGDTMYITAALLSWIPSIVVLRIGFYQRLKEHN